MHRLKVIWPSRGHSILQLHARVLLAMLSVGGNTYFNIPLTFLYLVIAVALQNNAIYCRHPMISASTTQNTVSHASLNVSCVVVQPFTCVPICCHMYMCIICHQCLHIRLCACRWYSNERKIIRVLSVLPSPFGGGGGIHFCYHLCGNMG